MSKWICPKCFRVVDIRWASRHRCGEKHLHNPRKKKKFIVVYYHSHAQSTCSERIMAKDEKDARRLFMLIHGYWLTEDSIEYVDEIRDEDFKTEEEILAKLNK